VITAEELADALLEDLSSKMPVLLRQFPEFTEEDINALAEVDPTPTKKYLTWLLRMSRKDRIEKDNFSTIIWALGKYDWLKNRADFDGERDINRYRTVDELVTAVEANSPQRMLNIPKKPEKCRGYMCVFKFAKGEERLLMAASAAVAWCTKLKEHATRYLSQGPVYLVTKNNEHYVLATHKGDHIHDIHDRPITDKVALEIAPLFYELGLLKPPKAPAQATAHNGNWIRITPQNGKRLAADLQVSLPSEHEMKAGGVWGLEVDGHFKVGVLAYNGAVQIAIGFQNRNVPPEYQGDVRRLAKEFGWAMEEYNRQWAYLAKQAERSEERRVGKECRSRWSPYH